ncbi:MAG: ATP synthase F1 subunit delta [Candidatus Eisenbacteria bacterium]|nr:ATP synthase F1 subunit delta [Candidatus Eisenbacteria bacterium]
MKQPAVARKYALALFRAARSHDALDAVAADLDAIRELLRTDPRFARVLAVPDIPAGEKRAFVGRVLSGRVGPLVVEFADLLLAKGRFGVLDAAADRYRALLEQERGIVRAQAVTAVKLTDAERVKLVEKLQIVTGRKVLMSESVDPAVLGGVLVTVGDRIIDGSVRSAWRDLRESLLAAPLTA